MVLNGIFLADSSYFFTPELPSDCFLERGITIEVIGIFSAVCFFSLLKCSLIVDALGLIRAGFTDFIGIWFEISDGISSLDTEDPFEYNFESLFAYLSVRRVINIS